MRKSYSREFKAAALDEIKKVGRSNREVAQEHDIPIKTLEKWITAYNKDNDYFEIGKPPEETNVKQLERQIARLKRENEILKKNDSLVGRQGISIYESICRLSEKYSVNTVCKTLEVNPSSYWYWRTSGRRHMDTRLELYQKIIAVYYENGGIYGAPKIAGVLNKSGIKCSVSTVSRAMKLLGIMSIVPKRFRRRASSMTPAEKKLIVNLVKDMKADRVNRIWTTDISYIKTAKEGFFYLITYIDTYSRAVVGWGLESTQTARQVISVLDSAVKHRNPPPGLIIHSDKGSQMRSWEYRGYLKKHKFIASYTSLDHSCDENAAHESFHALIKKECIYLKKPDTYGEAYSMIHEYIDNFYNPVRIHSSLNYISPLDFEAVYL